VLEILVLMGSQELLELPDLLGLRVLSEHQDKGEILERQERQDCLGHLVRQASLEQQGRVVRLEI